MNVDESIYYKFEHYLRTGELMLFSELELSALRLDKALMPFKKGSGESLKILIDRSNEALGSGWFDSYLSRKGRCHKCGMSYHYENLVFCNSGKHNLCFGCACGVVTHRHFLYCRRNQSHHI